MRKLIFILAVFLAVALASSFSGEPLVYPPNISIVFPVNNTNYFITTLDLNWTSNDTLEELSYSLNDGNNISLGSRGMCYQESANVSTSCGGLATGKYSLSGSSASNIIDGDWSTFASASWIGGLFQTVEINYSKPSGALNSSLWLVKDGGAEINLTINSSCWNAYNNKIVLKVRNRETNEGANVWTNWTCYNSSEYISLRYITTSDNIYEEAMWWNITPSLNTTLNLSEGKHNITIYGNNSAGEAGQTTYVYFTINQTPQWSNNQTNLTSETKLNNSVMFNATITDNYNFSSYTFSSNISGFWLNDSAVFFTTTTINSTIIINKTINESISKHKAWTVYFNDSIGNKNQTDIFTFNILNINPNVSNVSMTALPVVVGAGVKSHWLYSDADNDLIVYNETRFYVNRTNVPEAENQTTLLGGNASLNANITFSARVFDGLNWSDWKNSSQATVGDATAPSLISYTLQYSSLTDSSGNTNSFTAIAQDASSIVQSMDFDINGTINVTRSFTFTPSQNVNATYVIFASSESLLQGTYNITRVGITDGSSNSIQYYPNETFTVTAQSSGAPAGGGASGTTVIIQTSESFTCSGAGINYSISNIQGNQLGYSLLTDLGNTKKKCRDLVLRNVGKVNISISLACKDTGENLTAGFCKYVELKQSTVNLAPNSFLDKTIEMCILPLPEELEGQEFYFSIETKDSSGACSSQLDNTVELGILLPKFFSFRKAGSVNYPLIVPAMFVAIIAYLLVYLLFNLAKNKVLGVLIGFIVAIASFLLYLILA